MLANALRAGIPLDLFWRSTLWEIGQMIDASVWRAEQDQKLQLFQAWHTAALAGAAFAGKLPPLKRLLADRPDPRKPKKAQSSLHQLAAMQQWGTLLGLKYGES